MAAPEGSVTCPRKLPGLDCVATVCEKAAHSCNDKMMNAKQTHFHTFIAIFRSTTCFPYEC
jgi:hypothetical protein